MIRKLDLLTSEGARRDFNLLQLRHKRFDKAAIFAFSRQHRHLVEGHAVCARIYHHLRTTPQHEKPIIRIFADVRVLEELLQRNVLPLLADYRALIWLLCDGLAAASALLPTFEEFEALELLHLCLFRFVSLKAGSFVCVALEPRLVKRLTHQHSTALVILDRLIKFLFSQAKVQNLLALVFFIT